MDVVVATRNRLVALQLTLPLWRRELGDRGRIIVVDSSDEHSGVVDGVAALTARGAGPVEVVRGPVGLTRQRNVGLGLVTAPIVVFPDDDSVPFPGTLDAMLRVYALDTAWRIGAVCTAESPAPPEGVLQGPRAYEPTFGDRLKQRVAHARARLERRWAPDPFIVHGRSRYGAFAMPDWAASEDIVAVEWMTGFRMSFRTEVIRRIGFNESMSQYGLFEDVDASFGVWRTHLVVGARRGKIYHHRFPGPRGDPVRMGATQLLNRAYVVCRHAEPGSESRSGLLAYGRYKIAQYAAGAWKSGFNRGRLRGAVLAQRGVPGLLAARPEELDAVYQKSLDSCVGAGSRGTGAKS